MNRKQYAEIIEARLREELDRYLRIRRSLGWDLRTTERVLWRFIAFAESQSAEHISTNLFLKWQQSFGRASRQTGPLSKTLS